MMMNEAPRTDALIRFDAIKADRDASRTAIDPTAASCAATAEQVARRLLASRKRRARHFAPYLDGQLLNDPAWAILLDLFVAQCRGRRASLAASCAAAGVPQNTALRLIRYLAASGLIEPYADPIDRESTWLKLSAEADDAMRGFLAEEAAAS